MRLFTHKRHLHTLSHFFPPAFFPQVHVRTHTCTHTTAQSCNSLQSAAVPCRDERTTPCSENNWNQFKDTYYHSAPCLPPPPPTPSSPFPTFFLSLALSSRSLPLLPPTPAFLFFIVYHLSSSRLPPQFGSFSSAPFQPDTHTHTHACNHTPPPLCITWHCQVGETPLPSWTLTLFRLPGQRREMCAVRVRVCVWKRGQRQSKKKKREKRLAAEMRPA